MTNLTKRSSIERTLSPSVGGARTTYSSSPWAQSMQELRRSTEPCGGCIIRDMIRIMRCVLVTRKSKQAKRPATNARSPPRSTREPYPHPRAQSVREPRPGRPMVAARSSAPPRRSGRRGGGGGAARETGIDCGPAAVCRGEDGTWGGFH